MRESERISRSGTSAGGEEKAVEMERWRMRGAMVVKRSEGRGMAGGGWGLGARLPRGGKWVRCGGLP
jgi:hypothetical protein